MDRILWQLQVAIGLFCLLLAPVIGKAAPANTAINISLNRSRVERGETVEFRLQVAENGAPSSTVVQAVLLKPSEGAVPLPLKKESPGAYRGEIRLGASAAEGMYVVHVWTGEAQKPMAVGKATFLLGKIVADFFIAPYLDETQPVKDLESYLKGFRAVGGNFLVAHNLVTTTKAYYPSKIARTDVAGGSPKDVVELVLDRADREGYTVLLSVGWDMTRESPYQQRMAEVKALADELYALYKHHPSLAGFYSWQEGSGTYYVPYVREFSAHIKSLNRNLLTACAPHMDDPLLAGYLSTVEDLDIIIYQTGVMASYRPDNRKKYPFRRVRDFCSLGAGAKRLQDKIAINHVELFGYLENRLNPETAATTYENIYPQILSAASVTDADGISFFTYHAHVHVPLKKYSQVEQSRRAVADGIKAFNLIASKISRERNPLAVYFPYSDWIVERWPNYFLPALDALRVLGIPVDVLPYAPALEESVYPYYPIHMNRDVLARLLKERTVLLLPNVSGFQQTDSDLIKAFVEQGGVMLAFGPQIPMGRSFERKELFGGDEMGSTGVHSAIVVKDAIGQRVKNGVRLRWNGIQLPVWRANTARVIAAFEDGSAAVTLNKYGKGMVVAILPDAWTAAQQMPLLVRDVIEFALSSAGRAPLVDVLGMNERTDLTVTRTAEGFRVAVINHNAEEMEVMLRPLNASPTQSFRYVDLVSGNEIKTAAKDASLKVTVQGRGFRALEFRGIANN